MKNKPGYMLILSLTLISAAVLLVTRLLYMSMGHNAFDTIVVDRTKARLLAISGIQLAMSQLVVPEPKKGAQHEKSPDNKPVDKNKLFLQRILPGLNRWQTFKLVDEIDGINGTISICVMCENGKININTLFENGVLKKENQQVVTLLFETIEKQIDGKNLLKQIQDFLKERGYPLDDPTELLTRTDKGALKIPALSSMADFVFYEPSETKKSETQSSSVSPLYVTDLFTTWTHESTLEPWLFSDSVCTILGLKGTGGESVQQREQQVAQWLTRFKAEVSWPTQWNTILKPVYGKEYNTLAKNVGTLFASTFNPSVFSVIVYGTVGHVTQKAFAVLEMQQDNYPGVIIKKLYWI